MDADYSIERARQEDLEFLAQIELAAAKLFEGWQVADAVMNDSTSLDDFQEAFDASLLWVARSESDGPVGFAFVELVGEQPHLDELDVHPDHGRRGLGAALVREVIAWARAAGYRSLTLTTFKAVPWNAPYYTRLGFRVLEPAVYSPELERLVRSEARRGLDPDHRVVMLYAIDP